MIENNGAEYKLPHITGDNGMTKYVIWTDHRAGHNSKDRIIPLTAMNVIEAMNESAELCRNDSSLYCVCMFEKSIKNEYRQILRGENGISFHPEESTCKIIHRTTGSGKAMLSWYEIA